jgi:hypothetical protein
VVLDGVWPGALALPACAKDIASHVERLPQQLVVTVR